MKRILEYSEYVSERYNTKKDFVAAVTGEYKMCKLAIERDDIEAANQHLSKMKEYALEVAEVMDKTYMNRPDLKATLSRVKSKLKDVVTYGKYSTASFHKGEIQYNLDVIEYDWNETVKPVVSTYSSILKIGDGYEGRIENKYFRVRNDYGFRKNEYEPVMSKVDVAAKFLTDEGFSMVIGKSRQINLTHKPFEGQRPGWAGLYYPPNSYIFRDDPKIQSKDREGTIVLNVKYVLDSREQYPWFGADETFQFVFVHEMGHALWFEFLSEQDRQAFKKNWKIMKARDGGNFYCTPYGGTEAEEGFAELFAHYLMKPELKMFHRTDNYEFGISLIEKYRK
jgi:hypothetical protein